MPSRRPHTKSRHGCARCKRKKVKCDEQRPVCKRCHAVDAHCEYDTLAESHGAYSTLSGNDNTSIPPYPLAAGPLYTGYSSPSTPTSGDGTFRYIYSLVGDQQPPHQPLNLQDLRCMQHWCTSTCATLDFESGCLREWQVVIPAMAEHYTFLMHGILATAALHLASSSKTESEKNAWRSVSLAHVDSGLLTFRPLLSTINEETCHALFAFSSLLVVLGPAFHHIPAAGLDAPDPLQTVDTLTDLIVLLRGITTVLEQSRHWVEEGPLRTLVHRRDFPKRPWNLVPSDFEGILATLTATNARLNSGATAEMFDHAIGRLHETFHLFHHDKGNVALSISWPIGLKAEFVTYIRQRDTMALILVAYWGAMLHWFDDVWCFAGLGSQTVEAIRAVLDTEYHAIIKWPCEEAGIPIESLKEQRSRRASLMDEL